MLVMGIDVSFKATGIGIIEYENGVKKAIFKTTIKNPLDQSSGEYYVRIRKTVAYFLAKYAVDVAVIEDLNIRFLKIGKALFPIHGVVMEAVYAVTNKEPIKYNVSHWRHSVMKMNKYSKFQKAMVDELDINAKTKDLVLSIKNKVIDLVNRELMLQLEFEENDIADAFGLALAYIEKEFEKSRETIIYSPAHEKDEILRYMQLHGVL
jgi:Holliday junction resolvasome RuvABC endonuclease subunit